MRVTPTDIQYSYLALAEDCHECATVTGMNPRRSLPDPLATTDESTWLVVRNAFRETLEVTPLEPKADLHAVLNAAREARVVAGWKADPIERCCSFFFCSKGGARVMVGIERRDPANPTLGHR
jgi:hypothetical protein